MRSFTLAGMVAAVWVAPAHGDCLNDIKGVIARSSLSGPYAIEMVAGDDETLNIEIIPFVAMRSKATMRDRATEMIVRDGKAWAKAGDTWTILHEDTAAQLISAFSVVFFVGAPGGGAAIVPDRVTEPECLGRQELEGKEYVTFKFNPEIAGSDTRSTLYADPTTLLPAAVIGTTTSVGKTIITRATYRYDPSITISPPTM